MTDSDFERTTYMRDMFTRIARHYDLMNRLMTFGRDVAWRRQVVREALAGDPQPRGGWLLDVATGTGDIALETLSQASNGTRTVGVDFTLPMMHFGIERYRGERVRWCGADALALPFADATFDAVTSGFLMRNLAPEDVPHAFREQMRVVRPGGRVVCLDTTPQPDSRLRPLIDFHMRRVIPVLGRLVSAQPDAYRYLPASTLAFLTADQLAEAMRRAGLVEVHYRRMMFGTVAIHIGARPSEDGQ
jgi:demethylmenaquinone methyltransferase/2-methoxy-6-polyprenyl-1,4-benzoquinol methylase